MAKSGWTGGTAEAKIKLLVVVELMMGRAGRPGVGGAVGTEQSGGCSRSNWEGLACCGCGKIYGSVSDGCCEKKRRRSCWSRQIRRSHVGCS